MAVRATGNLRWRLLALNVPVIAAVILVVWLAIDYLAADYFATLMEQYKISPAETHQMFLDAVHRYLIQASIAAMVLAVGLSFLLTRRALRPLSDMAEVTRRLATGDYSARVAIASNDEVGRLGVAVNQMADDLERIEKLRKQMVGDIAHELRTPLTNIRGYHEGLMDGVVTPSDQTFKMLQQEILRLVRLVEDLNELSKADAGAAELRRDPVDVAGLVGRVIELDREEFASRNISVEVTAEPEEIKVTGDTDKLSQVFRNLTQNAWQYTPEGGHLRVSASRNGADARVVFTNNGRGIAADDLPLIFERFYRGDKSRSRDSGGAGIGLAIVKELVEAHGGRVGAESDDGETRIWVSFPV